MASELRGAAHGLTAKKPWGAPRLECTPRLSRLRRLLDWFRGAGLAQTRVSALGPRDFHGDVLALVRRSQFVRALGRAANWGSVSQPLVIQRDRSRRPGTGLRRQSLSDGTRPSNHRGRSNGQRLQGDTLDCTRLRDARITSLRGRDPHADALPCIRSRQLITAAGRS